LLLVLSQLLAFGAAHARLGDVLGLQRSHFRGEQLESKHAPSGAKRDRKEDSQDCEHQGRDSERIVRNQCVEGREHPRKHGNKGLAELAKDRSKH